MCTVKLLARPVMGSIRFSSANFQVVGHTATIPQAPTKMSFYIGATANRPLLVTAPHIKAPYGSG